MFRSLLRLAPLVLLCALVQTAMAAIAAEPDKAELKKLVDGLRYQKGTIVLKNGLARINTPEDFRFLDAADAETVLSRIWGNPPGSNALGLLMPTGMTPVQSGAWAVIITYEEEGYVKDDDAAKIDYTDLLKKMKEGSVAANAEREKQGYPSIELVGWAKPPRYDQATHKLYWAKELRFGGDKSDTLNYNIRVLGRRGVLVLNAVAGMDQLAEIEQSTPAILRMVDFQDGNRYADFNKSTDKVATYGIAALIAGGVLAKTGLLKVIIGAIIAAKKFVIIGAIAFFAAIKKFFARITGRGQPQP
jgi:uncharacterized membrane-anchored protein